MYSGANLASYGPGTNIGSPARIEIKPFALFFNLHQNNGSEAPSF